MGLGIRELFATNTEDQSGDILLAAWIPVKREDGYHWPPNTPLGEDIWVPNLLGLKEEEGSVPVEIVKSDTETGIWLACENGYFIDEQWLFNYKPRYRENRKEKIDYKYAEATIKDDNVFGIHVLTDIEMRAGDGPIPVTLRRLKKEELKEKKYKGWKWWKK